MKYLYPVVISTVHEESQTPTQLIIKRPSQQSTPHAFDFINQNGPAAGLRGPDPKHRRQHR